MGHVLSLRELIDYLAAIYIHAGYDMPVEIFNPNKDSPNCFDITGVDYCGPEGIKEMVTINVEVKGE